MIRIAVIGCGEHAEIGHAIPLARFRDAHPGEVEFIASCDLREQRARYFCERYGFKTAYSSVDEMLARESFDVCISVVPVSAISDLGVKLLERGIRCVLEKPLGGTQKEIAALLDAAERTRTHHMVSVNRRFMPFLTEAIEWVRGMGELRYIRATMSRKARSEPDFLVTTAIHSLDALRYIAGESDEAKITSMRGSSSVARWFGIDLQFKKGIVGRVDVLPTTGLVEETYELFGNDFSAIVRAPFGPNRGLWCYHGNRLVLHRTDEGMPDDVVFGFYAEARTLIDGIANGRPLSPSVFDVAPSVELCLALAEQAR